MATSVQFVTAVPPADMELPEEEAAFFYGLFLRGHSAERLRQDIEVPPAVLAKWHREAEREPQLRDIFSRMVEYRRHVLAIFDLLVESEGNQKSPEHAAGTDRKSTRLNSSHSQISYAVFCLNNNSKY